MTALSALRLSRLRAATEEKALSDFYAGYVESGRGGAFYLARHPLTSLAGVIGIARLPKVYAVMPDTVDGNALYKTLSRPGPLRHAVRIHRGRPCSRCPRTRRSTASAPSSRPCAGRCAPRPRPGSPGA